MIDLTMLTTIESLRKSGEHEEAKKRLVQLALQHPTDPAINYAAACVHDYMGLESQAVPYYVAAIHNGLTGNDLRGAYLGLGSTYRTLGRYAESKQTLQDGLEKFPNAVEISVFLAMTHYNLGNFHESVSSLLTIIANTTSHSETQGYERAIRFYAKNLDQRWE